MLYNIIAESGILADLSMSYDDPDSSGHCRVGRSDSSITTESADSVTISPSSPVTSSKSCPYPSLTPVSLYVNNKLIPITPSPSHKNMPMTEVKIFRTIKIFLIEFLSILFNSIITDVEFGTPESWTATDANSLIMYIKPTIMIAISFFIRLFVSLFLRLIVLHIPISLLY